MSLPALEDITAHRGTADPIDGVIRDRDVAQGEGHADHHGDDAVGVPARRGLRHLLHRQRLHRLSARRAVRLPVRHPLPGGVDLQPARIRRRPTSPGCGWPTTGSAVRAPAARSTPAPSPTATPRTVDYHCAWDQGKHLWMIYLMRVVDAQVVFDKPGSVVLWTNCHHPFYDNNPYPGDRAAGAAGVGGRLLGHVRPRPPAGAEEPQGDCRVPPPQRTCRSPRPG